MNKLATFLLALCAAGHTFAGDFESLLAPPVAPSVPLAQTGRASAAVHWLEEKDVKAALTQDLTTRWDAQGELRLVFARPWSRIRLADETPWDLTVTEVPPNGLGASMVLRFAITQGDRRVGEWTVLVRAQLWRPVWVATRRMDRGGMVDLALCSQQMLDVLREPQPVVPVNTDLSQYELAQTVSTGRPLAWRDLAPRVVIRKGDEVEITAGGGALAISMKVTAMSSGAVGETITVRNRESKRDFQAQVTGVNSAQVRF